MFNRTLKSIFAGAALIGSCFASVNVSKPTNNSTVTSPAQFIASATPNHGSPITAIQVYSDNNLIYQHNSSSINTTLALAAGHHNIVIQAWDSVGGYQKANLGVTINGGGGNDGPPGPPPGGGQTFWNINQMGGWENCDTCAGPGGHGPHVPHSLTQHVSNPSTDGQAGQFWIGGSRPYSAALWWKQLGATPSAAHFTYDLYFYVNDANAPQALEFDVNQSVNGHKYIFGHECNARGTGQWDVWDTKHSHWVPTGVACHAPAPYQWHHLILAMERTGSQTHFISVTLDGHTSYFNKYFDTFSVGAQELNAAVQLDTNFQSKNFSLWTDKINLNYW